MARADYERVVREMRLADGLLWPIPVTLDVSSTFAQRITPGNKIALRDPEGVMLAALQVEDLWQPDRIVEAEYVYGTRSPHHKGVAHLLAQAGAVCLGGKIEGIQTPDHYDFESHRHTPAELRAAFGAKAWRRVAAFQTRNPMHRAHFELTVRAAREHQVNLLIHPVVGMTKPGDINHYSRVRCYQAILPHYPKNTAMLSLLPLSMRLAGPREALWHAIIRRNYGCTHLIVGRDHAGPGTDTDGKPFYPPYAAQELMREHAEELGITMVPFRNLVYAADEDAYLPADDVDAKSRVLEMSGTELRNRLAEDRDIPKWFTFPEVAAELRRSYPPRAEQGFTVFFTGLSGAGKSTVAKALMSKFLELGGRPVTLLDGDIVRKNLSSELGFSRDQRNLNILRIGFVANEITKNGGIAICAPIAPYDEIRKRVRELISHRGGFILVHVSTSLDVCEQRDRKGLYAKARAGIIKEFTGISDPYEPPEDADVVLDTNELSVDESCQEILLHLERKGYIGIE